MGIVNKEPLLKFPHLDAPDVRSISESSPEDDDEETSDDEFKVTLGVSEPYITEQKGYSSSSLVLISFNMILTASNAYYSDRTS